MVENAAGGAAPSIVDRLTGKTILLTGVTGFLGQVIFERLLGEVPDGRIVLLVRSQTGSTSRDRVEYLFRKPAFDVLRGRIGDDGLRALLDERVTIVDGDFSRGVPQLPGDIDIAIHSAATVSFDPPIDEGFQTNLFGAMNLYRGVIDSGSRPCLVHVSTAYVAGVAKGVVPEDTLDHKVDWRTEGELALQARRDVEAQSRRPEMLDDFMDKASKEHSRAGPHDGGRRSRAAPQGLGVEAIDAYGRSRARSLGWPDVYTFTKAMGERAVEELADLEELPLSIVRPSIIESALFHPAPGWIDGFKMADPIIRAYGLGQIPEFPGIPEGIVDIIPVDMVVNAILAVAGTPPEPRRPAYYHVSSGSRNPLQYHELYRYVRAYFEAHPLPERGRGEHKVPEWSFPGSLSVERMIDRADKLTDVAEKIVTHMPKSKRMRDLVSRVDRDKVARGVREAVLGSVRRVHRGRGDLHRRPHARVVGVAHGGGPRAVPVRLGDHGLAVLPAGRALAGRDAEPPRAVPPRTPDAGRQDPRTRAAGRRALRHGGHDHHVERRGVLRVDADGRPAARRVAARARERLREDPSYLQIDRRDRGTSSARSSGGTRVRPSTACNA